MNKLRCAIIDDYQQAALELADWASLADRVEVRSLRQHLDSDKLVEEVADCEILVIMRERSVFNADVLRRLPRLQLLITSGMRNSAIDLAAAKAQNITVSGTASRSEPPVELTWALILGLARNLTTEAGNLRNGGSWQSTIGADLAGRRLGIVGLGKIGTRVARVASAFGMTVLAWSPHLTAERATEANIRLVTRTELFEQSDFVTVHMVLSDSTRGLIGSDELSRMQRHAYFINTSRAGLVDREALIQVLKERSIAGAGLDVFDREPLPADDPIRSMSNVLATPHLGYVTYHNYRTYFQEAVEDIKAYLSGDALRLL